MTDLNIHNVSHVDKLWVRTPDDDCSVKWIEFTFQTKPFKHHYKHDISELEHSNKFTIFIETIDEQRQILEDLRRFCTEGLIEMDEVELCNAATKKENPDEALS